MPNRSHRHRDHDVRIDRRAGDKPAMNRPGAQADDDRAVTPGNLGWDEPSVEAAETLEGAVRRADNDQNGEPALPNEVPGR